MQAFIFAGLLLAAAVPEPVASPPIDVIAPRLPDAEIDRQASQYVRTVLPVASFNQYARWSSPVCIKVTGIEDGAAVLVRDRVRAVASDAGVRIARPGCKPNLNIVFSEDGRTTTAVIARKKPRAMMRLDVDHRRKLASEAHPIRWWHGIEPGDGAGAPASSLSTALMSASNQADLLATLPVNANTIQTNSYNSSLIDTHLVVSITSAMVVVDVTLANGKPLDAVADYVALVALSPTRFPAPVPEAPSILRLFEPSGDTAPALSGWDKAYLAALARMTPNRTAMRQRHQLAAGVSDAIKQ